MAQATERLATIETTLRIVMKTLKIFLPLIVV
jgi:hypothetical protein